LLEQRDNYGRIVLVYGARSPEEILFSAELKRWRVQLDLDLSVIVDHATPSWRGRVGVVTTLISDSAFDPVEALALVCGPEVMMRFTLMELRHRGVAPDRTYVSIERNMKCAVGFCGHCQFGPQFVCRDGPIFSLPRIESLFTMPEV
jgi:NAD(P)H-flavin reductase